MVRPCDALHDDGPASRDRDPDKQNLMEKVHFLTLGCPKNVADSELMLGALTGSRLRDYARSGKRASSGGEHLRVYRGGEERINSTRSSKRLRSRSAAPAASGRRGMPGAALRRSSCGEEMPEVDVFVGTGNFLDLPELLRRTETPEVAADSLCRARPICCLTAAMPRVTDRRFLHGLLEDFGRLQSQVRLLHYPENSWIA